ncbi:class D beta-lactamase [Caldalkalibacillus salinus]|uniref:class D beta-lactamase n=1 Tax=Caldalkalibacillus salinus TaxID=2803787 RepID=UPI00192371CE|nr:class D beta-lactamase [Caldalkalibacillus salinus]
MALLAILGLFLTGCTVLEEQPTQAASNQDKPLNVNHMEVDQFFEGKDGTFVFRDMNKESTYIYNEERANQAFAPQSTFKVPHSLIGLQVGAVVDEYDIKYWDGKERAIEVWNQDHTLGSGLRHSVVWYYRAMARDIGEERMQEWIDNITYGNQDISGGIDQFWLSSSLQITPIEQARFMEALYHEDLPFDQDVMKTVKRMMIQMEGDGDDYILYAKTGQGSGIGWYVGFIKTENQAYAFATNMASTSADAKKTTIDILKAYHLITD